MTTEVIADAREAAIGAADPDPASARFVKALCRRLDDAAAGDEWGTAEDVEALRKDCAFAASIIRTLDELRAEAAPKIAVLTRVIRWRRAKDHQREKKDVARKREIVELKPDAARYRLLRDTASVDFYGAVQDATGQYPSDDNSADDLLDAAIAARKEKAEAEHADDAMARLNT